MGPPLAPADSNSARLARRLSAGLAVIVLIGGISSFVGWAADIQPLTDWSGTSVSIQPNTTVAAMAVGLALLLARSWSRTAAALGLVATLIGAGTLFQHASGVDLGIDRLLLFDRSWGHGLTTSPGRMGVPGSVSWTLLGSGLLLLRGGPKARRAASTLGLIAALLALLSLIGFAYGADRLYSLPRLTAIAMQAAVLTFAAGAGLMAAVPEQGIVAMLLRDDAGGLLMRRLLPPVI